MADLIPSTSDIPIGGVPFVPEQDPEILIGGVPYVPPSVSQQTQDVFIPLPSEGLISLSPPSSSAPADRVIGGAPFGTIGSADIPPKMGEEEDVPSPGTSSSAARLIITLEEIRRLTEKDGRIDEDLGVLDPDYDPVRESRKPPAKLEGPRELVDGPPTEEDPIVIGEGRSARADTKAAIDLISVTVEDWDHISNRQWKAFLLLLEYQTDQSTYSVDLKTLREAISAMPPDVFQALSEVLQVYSMVCQSAAREGWTLDQILTALDVARTDRQPISSQVSQDGVVDTLAEYYLVSIRDIDGR